MTRPHAAIAEDAIDERALSRRVDDPAAGAVATFAGVVRNHDRSRDVVGIDYSSHPDAAAVLQGVVERFADRDDLHAVAAEHRVGELAVGDVALAVAVSASHRREAFAAMAELVDAIKAEVPIWKKQHFADGTHEWSMLP